MSCLPALTFGSVRLHARGIAKRRGLRVRRDEEVRGHEHNEAELNAPGLCLAVFLGSAALLLFVEWVKKVVDMGTLKW